MFERRSLGWPILLAVIMIVLLVALTVGWILLNVAAAIGNSERAPLYWVLLSIGSAIFAIVVAGVIMYLALAIQQINLNRRQTNFIDSVTHELKSPIASLKLYLQTLGRRSVTDEQRADFYRFMMADVDRLDDLINHLLDAAKVTRPVVEEDLEQIRLDSLIQQAMESTCLRYSFPHQAISLKCQPIQRLARAMDFNIIIRNLMDNAVKYAGQPPEISVSLEIGDRPGWARLQVQDNGPGIPRHLRRKVFGRFYRVGSELERRKPGTGLGLYLVRSLVLQMGGKIAFRDGPVGGGTTVEVLLPSCTPMVESQMESQSPGTAART